MNKRVIYWTIILLVSLSGCTSKTVDKETQATNDSIQKYLDLAGTDSLDSKLRNKYNDKAFSLVDLNKNDTLTRFYLSSISYNYLGTNDWVSFKKTAKIHFEKSIAVKDTLNLARYYRYKGSYFRKTSVIDSSLYYFIKAEKFYKKTNDEFGLAKVYYCKSIVQVDADDYLGAELSANLAYSYYKKKTANRLTLQVLIMQGLIANNLKDYNKAIKLYKNCIYKLQKNNLEKVGFYYKSTCLNNIGNAYREQKKYHEAISYFKLVFKEKNLKKENCELYALSLNNIGFCYMQLNKNNELPTLFFRAGKILDSIGNKNEYMVSNLFISQFYFKNKDTLHAQLYAQKALKIAQKINSPYYYLTALSNAGSVDGKKAPKYIKEYHEKNDSLLFIERNARNQYYKIQLETNEITQEKDTAIKQKWIVGGIALVVILIIVLLLIITRQRSKQKELQFQQSQQKANEEIYDLMLTQKNKEELARQSEKKRIALELHDGVMNKLASTRLNLNMLSHQKDEETINKCLAHIEGIYIIEQEIRNIAHNLNLDIFNETNSYVALLNDFIATQNAVTSSQYKLEIGETINWISVSSVIKMNLYRIIQEASHNANKFAQATNVMISLVLDENNICLSITDNGKGFDTDAIMEGIGLKNIKQRVQSLNGKFVIQSINNKSTSINIAIPFAAQ